MCGPARDEHRRAQDENAEQGDTATHDNIGHSLCLHNHLLMQ